jgi:hypothetical protein
MYKFVGGVEGVVEGVVEYQSRAVIVLSRVSDTPLYVTRETNKSIFKQKKSPLAYMDASTPSTPSTRHGFQGLRFFAASTAASTPPTLIIFIKKMQKKVCGSENIKEFRAELKAAAPEFYALAKDLFTSGLIDGLRGATLEIGPFSEQPLIEVKGKDGKALYCKNCGHWQRDTVGDGTGIGVCLLNVRPSQIKWPRQAACEQVQEIV